MSIEEIIRHVVREEVHSALTEVGRAPGKALTTAEVAYSLGVVPRVVVDMIRSGGEERGRSERRDKPAGSRGCKSPTAKE
jgi:hypothetical protein